MVNLKVVNDGTDQSYYKAYTTKTGELEDFSFKNEADLDRKIASVEEFLVELKKAKQELSKVTASNEVDLDKVSLAEA